MEANEENLASLVHLLNATLHYDPSVRNPAEKTLHNNEQVAGYPLLLLVVIGRKDVQEQVQVTASITFKNFIRRNWPIIDGEESHIFESDRDLIRDRIVSLMLDSSDRVQTQLSESISLIGRQDFPQKWPRLLPILTSEMLNNDMKCVTSCLHTAHALFKRYRHEMKSDELWREIKLVLDHFASPLTELFVKLLQMSGPKARTLNADQLRYPFAALTLVTKIFQSLNAQDLPEFFEDNMHIWMPGFLSLLEVNLPLLATDSDDDPGPVEQLKCSICDNVVLYAQKYDEEFHQYLEPFVGVIWNLLVNTNAQPKFDLLVSKAMNFLATVCERHQYRAMFEREGALKTICQSVILKNMVFRESDQELFEDNPDEYVRRDIEGSDVDTRRRSASDFVRALCHFFESPIVLLFGEHIQRLLVEYNADRIGKWTTKDAVFCLIGALATRGGTAQLGATKTSQCLDLTDFYFGHVKHELMTDEGSPVLKADALKYAISFRSQLPPSSLVEIVTASTRLLLSDSVVVRIYAAHALERLLVLKLNKICPVTPSDLDAPTLLNNLFQALLKRGTEESEYLMKAVMRSLSVLSAQCVPFVEQITLKLVEKVSLAAKNPNKPHYNHYLFESLCVLIKQSATCFASPFFIPPSATLLNTRPPPSPLPPPYLALLPFLVRPELWERSGNIPALVRLLQSYLRIDADSVVQSHLSSLLGVFQKLISSKVNDRHGFLLLNSVLQYVDFFAMTHYLMVNFQFFCSLAKLQSSMTAILTVLLRRLQVARTVKFAKGLIVFLCLLTFKRGATTMVEEMEKLQVGMFRMIIEKVFIRDLQKISDSLDGKICCVGISQLLADAVPQLGDLWCQLVTSLVALLELPQDGTEDDSPFDVESVSGYTNVYSQLAFVTRIDTDPTGVADVKAHLAKSLARLSSNYTPQALSQLFGPLETKVRQFLSYYALNAGVSLS